MSRERMRGAGRIRGAGGAGGNAFPNTPDFMTWSDTTPVTWSDDPNAFTPMSIPNMGLWYDGADATSVTSSGGVASNVNDKSGNARNGTASGALQPLYGTTTVNGQNCFTFTKSQYFLWDGSFLTGQPYTIFIVDNPAVYSGSNNYYIGGSAGSTDSNLQIGYGSGGGGYKFAQYSDDLNYIASMPAGITRVWCVNNTSINKNIIYNGAVRATLGNSIKLLSNPGQRLGASGVVSASGWFNGSIPEMLIYTRDISDTEKNQVGTYLNNKWGAVWANL